MGDEQQRARELVERLLERLAALEVEVVGRLVEDQHVGARLDEDASDSRRRSPPESTVERLLGLLAGEQEAPEQRPRLARGQPGERAGRPRARCARCPPTSSSACWDR